MPLVSRCGEEGHCFLLVLWSMLQATAIARTFRKYLEVDLVKMQLGLLGAIYCRTRDGFSFSYPESIDLSNWNRIMRTVGPFLNQ